jgi:2-octaprenyl-6-methoxyphenol hydroxylase
MSRLPSESDFDIAVCGAGPVGLTLASLLAARGVAPARIALVDGRSLDQAKQDPRAIALSWGSRQILEQVGAWPLPSTPIREIHVSRRNHFGRTLIDSKDYDLPALGYVARYGDLISALDARVQATGIQVLRPVQVIASNETRESVWLNLSGNQALTAKVLIQAEGGIYGEQTAKTLQRDYDQTAVVAHVTSSAPLPGRAFERFTDEGPLALLPQEGGYSMVWCMRPASAQALLSLNNPDFLERLQLAFGMRVGRFVSISPRHAFPLGLNARPAATTRMVAIGNAAQTLHPVAGQGLNLGLRDATVLARLLASDISPDALVNFAQAREADRSTTIRVTDTLARLFASAPDGALSQSLLGASLGMLDLFPPARHLIAEHMMFGRR